MFNLRYFVIVLLLFSSNIYSVDIYADDISSNDISAKDIFSKVDPHVYMKAYPDYIKSVQDNYLIWKDGTKMPLKLKKEGKEEIMKEALKNEKIENKKIANEIEKVKINTQKTIQEAIIHPDLYMQIAIPYKEGKMNQPPSQDSDPGRIRYIPFFQKMYGNTEEEVKKNLVEVRWMPNTFTGKDKVILLVTKVNNVNEKMKSISNDLEGLLKRKPEYKKYLENPGGTFKWRKIAGTDRLSAHSFGMTIDINAKYSNYWLWDYKKEKGLSIDSIVKEDSLSPQDVPPYKNDIPWEIVEIFEKYHFIWGGKMFHYDTMHFEFRPELL